MALPEIFAEKERVDPGGVAAHDHVLVVVGKNLRLDEIARAQEIGDGARFAHGAESALRENVRRLRDRRAAVPCRSATRSPRYRKAKVLRDIDPLEAGQRAHPDIVKLREQKCVDEMPAIDGELRIIDRLLRDLEPRRARAEKTAAPAPIEFHLRLARAGDQIRQIEAKEVMTFDHIRIAFLDQSSSGA